MVVSRVSLCKSGRKLMFIAFILGSNLGEVVLEQRNLGIDGVIVDHVLEMVRVARHMSEPDAVVGAAMPRRTVSVV